MGVKGGHVDHIDTSAFPQAIHDIEKMANAMKDIIENLDDIKMKILVDWVGEGRNQFEKSYVYIKRTLADGTEASWDIYEALISSQETLIENDIAVANGIKTYN